MGTRLWLIGLLLAALMAGSAPAQDNEAPKLTDTGGTAFALDIYKAVREEPGNLFFSPFSIRTALAMTYAGAREKTAGQMAEVLHFDLPQEKLHPQFRQLLEGLKGERDKQGYELHIANALWGQEGFQYLDDFLATTSENYGAGLRMVDYVRAAETARQTINKWVEEETRGKIQDLIAQGVLNADTRLVLTNAIYFLGDWQSPFKKEATRELPFKKADGTEVKTPMMSQTARFGYAKTELLTRPPRAVAALEMPYKGGDLSMVILLPDEVDGIANLQTDLTPELLDRLLAGLKPQSVQVIMPKLKMTQEMELSETLEAMGMPLAFSDAADFSGMTEEEPLKISKVIHKAFVNVDEKGTEAAAATAVVMEKAMNGGPGVPPILFNADHPFIFLIRDRRSGAILFMGRVMAP